MGSRKSIIQFALYIRHKRGPRVSQRDSIYTKGLIYWINILRSGQMARRKKIDLLYHCHSNIDLYGPLCNCLTEMQEGQNTDIHKCIQRTTMVDPIKDIDVQLQKKLASKLVNSGLHCFDSGFHNRIEK
jgi:hypothetical protein